MTTPAHLTYTQLQTRVARALRMPTSNTEQMSRVAELLNFAYRDLANRRDWWWLRKRTVTNTVAKVTAGSVSVTQASTAITFSTAPTTPQGGTFDPSGFSFLVPTSSPDPCAVYRLDANWAAGITSGNLDAAYTGETNTAAAYRLYKDRYALPDDLGVLVQVRRYGSPLAMRRVGIEEMYSLKLTDQTEGRPEVYCLDDFVSTGNPTTARMLVIHPYPDVAYRMEIVYKQELNTELANSTEPFMPDEFRHLLVYGALMMGYPEILNDTERGGYFATLYEAGLLKMTMVNRDLGDDAPGVQADMTGYRPVHRRRKAGRMSLGSWFDRLPSQP